MRPTRARLLATDLCIFALFLGLVTLLRLPTFALSVVDWDESLYLLMARELLQDGALPYTTLWDHKPPGIYLLFAAAQLLFGTSVTTIRVLTCLTVACSSTLLYGLGGRAYGRRDLGLLAGLLYAVFSLRSGGLAANTEIFFTPWVLVAMTLLLGEQPQRSLLEVPRFRHRLVGLAAAWARRSRLTSAWARRRDLFAGLALGVALQIKTVVVFDLLAMLATLAFWTWRARQRGTTGTLGRAAWRGLLVVSGAALPCLAVALWYAAAGHWDAYLLANVHANLTHSSGSGVPATRVLGALEAHLHQHALLWLSAALAPMVASATSSKCKEQVQQLWIWLLCGFVGVCFTRRFYAHYFLQILPQLCLLTAYFTITELRALSVKRPRSPLTTLLLAALVAAPIYSGLRAAAARPRRDVPREISAYLKPRLPTEATIYVADYEPVIYFLVGARPPTRYAFPPFLLYEHFATVARVDPQQELEAIFARRPLYVVATSIRRGSPAFRETLERHLARHYVAEHRIAFVHQGALAHVTLHRREERASETSQRAPRSDQIDTMCSPTLHLSDLPLLCSATCACSENRDAVPLCSSPRPRHERSSPLAGLSAPAIRPALARRSLGWVQQGRAHEPQPPRRGQRRPRCRGGSAAPGGRRWPQVRQQDPRDR